MNTPVNVCVVGAGLMGHGIAQTFAQAGHAIFLFDVDKNTLELAPLLIEKNLRQMGIDPKPVLDNIELCSDIASAVFSTDFIIEAITENLWLKQALFSSLAELAPSHAILASNTSVIPITDIGEKLSDKVRSRLVGTHWWNPPHLIPLVEIIKTSFTDDAVFETTFDLILSLGKQPVKVFQDVPGFIGNRLQHAMWREALYLVSTGVCDAETIDLVVKNSFGMRMPFLGPMENADLVGLKLIQQVHQFIFPHLCNEQSPRPMIEDLIKQGFLGMESGKGLQNWPPEKAENVRKNLSNRLIDSLKD
ncbi:3-hydroxyacyl-CoA dehydrogenase family protein [Vreelandella glaciei]|uniref:3-hydroxyacyl-CoA dehydrogenase family protein n=2 Tax=Halomonadaceae TaxID=28256 RepID=UPI00300106FF